MTSSLVEIALKSQCSYSYANTKVSSQCPDTGIQKLNSYPFSQWRQLKEKYKR
ncbi:hypothetical protein [Wolbachia endosymbiont (group A) of Anomoia purmunda]|uniref:hypothetical protein n=1 Tax=Wolbachia endosymbiont (group A) of Anomoia purmunda TaxID=2953978 RepID=UPI00222EF616|nr:hypothetical protein [Wolbachia endosymbiont (group A) of Anomoia purmunda]